MFRTVIAAAVIAIGINTYAGADHQMNIQAPCNTHEAFIRQLETEYEESVVAVAIDGYGNLVEIYANTSPGKDTWTVIVTSPNGRSCAIAEGTNWEALPPVNKDPKA